MSYDLVLFGLPKPANPAQFCEQLQEQEEQRILDEEGSSARPLDERVRARMQKLADSPRSLSSGFEQFEPPSPAPWIELTDEKHEVQVTISEQAVHITLPYFRSELREKLSLVARCVETLHRDAGLVAFDPQLGRVVTADDMGLLEKQYRDMDRHLPEITARKEEASQKKSWWKLW